MLRILRLRTTPVGLRCLSQSKYTYRRHADELTPEELKAKSLSFLKDLDDIRNKTSGTSKNTTNQWKETATHEEVKQIINTSRGKPKFVDLENKGLNLNLSNKQLVEQIIKNSEYRVSRRLDRISQKWRTKFSEIVESFPDSIFEGKKGSREAIIQREFKDEFKNAHIAASRAGKPLSIGDLVIIDEGSTDFFLVVACPRSFDATNYTFINSKGRIIFGPSVMIRFRIPSFLPKHFHPILESMVMLEEKTLDIAPIGVVDKEVSRSEEARPVELRKNGTTRKTLEHLDNSAFEITEEDEFITAQTSSSLLKNSAVNTFVVPPSARELYSSLLTQLSIDSMTKFKSMSLKLELIHRALQYDESDALNVSPRIVSIFQILYLIQDRGTGPSVSGLSHFRQKHLDWFRRDIGKVFSLKGGEEESSLGKIIRKPDKQVDYIERSQYDLSSYFAIILLLRKQTRLWKINEQNSINPVTSIIILPLSNKVGKDVLASRLKSADGNVINHIIKKLNGNTNDPKPKFYDETIELLKDFIIDNLRNDFELESLCASLVRKIGPHLPSYTEYSYEYGRSKAYDILQALGETEYDNPARWSWGLELNSIGDAVNKEYYDFLQKSHEAGTSNSLDDFYDEDPIKDHREDYREPIFCIDSESAHEIDDGISLKEHSDKYTVSIHIANPTSFIKPRSNLSQIAFSKGTTSYLPEGPIKMFPDFVSDLSGLGVNGQTTRTFGIEYDIPKNFQEMELKSLQKNIQDSGRIKFYNTYNYPEGYTYKHVDKILSGEVADSHFDTLKTLRDISATLKKIRVETGAAQDFGMNNTELKVQYCEDSKPDEFRVGEDGYTLRVKNVEIFLGNPESSLESTLLVSEMMIAANHLTSRIGRQLGLPLIYRNQKRNLSAEILQQMKELSGGDFHDRSRVLSLMNSAKIDMINQGHESLGLGSYSQITSPLRRYTDMVNQWMFQSHFRQETCELSVSNIVNHLQAKEIINKQFDQVSQRFWKGIFLREYFRIRNEIGAADEMSFKVFLGKHLSKDKLQIALENFSNFKTVLKIDETVPFDMTTVELNASGNLDITRIDFIENELIFELVNSA
ncbi:RNB-domain-containing protein [Yamadazyma tenuis ATCC 10573]|uniref:RNB-domain-containing protein n=1 Tax=Candida tenuis (strain ATCC 10573 / BCRC 21748 / CBS 615 / JCM 9827 / NBRC 10315 / NRRL Y-1498 / VKM Y-70) TaxID=590646 RepID=G3B5C8_CANTC|nr:RNB-domain-containing protein [Yamadazyma tenuis ATCC 10573]EGV63187.1 RNB-domain-containing protein [Yamadazyma tenuis ATCC 10573]